jgi:hypothetical protein
MTPRELTNLYRKCKRLYFGNRVPLAKCIIFSMSNRLTRAAACCKTPHDRSTISASKKALIIFSTHYFKRHTEEFEIVMLHEMIHLYTPNGHGYQFLRERDRINRLRMSEDIGMPLVMIHSYERAKLKSFTGAYDIANIEIFCDNIKLNNQQKEVLSILKNN